MKAGLAGFLVGAVVPVVLAEIGAFRRFKRAEREGRWWAEGPTDWDATMPAPRTSLRPRWESSSDPADEDDLLEFLVTVIAVILLTGGLLFGAGNISRFIVFFLCGGVLGTTGVGVYSWIAGRHMPPGARHVIIRGAVVGIAAGIALHWFARTVWRGISYVIVHDVVATARIVKRPGQVHDLFGSDGVLLYISLAIGLMFAIGLLIMALIDLAALLAATRLGEGSRGAFTAWLAQFYPRRQLRLWISTAILGVLMLLLVSGALLKGYDRWQKETEIKPGPVPIQSDPPGTVVPLTIPATTVVPATTVAETTTVAPPPVEESTTLAP